MMKIFYFFQSIAATFEMHLASEVVIMIKPKTINPLPNHRTSITITIFIVPKY